MARVLLIVGGGIAAYKSLELVRAVKKIPELIQRMDEYYPPKGAAPPPPPLPEIAVINDRSWWSYVLVGAAGAAVGALLLFVLG